jgi:IS1 family transposase
LIRNSTIDVSKEVKDFWAYYENFTVLTDRIVNDPFYPESKETYYRYKHESDSYWIWIRTRDNALVYEQFQDGTPKSWTKKYEGGIQTNKYLFTSVFRVPRCSNPFSFLSSYSPVERP